MKRLCKAACTGLASLSLIFGAYSNSKSEVSKLYTQPRKMSTSHAQTETLAEKILKLSHFLFPNFCDTYEGAIYIGRNESGIDVYAVISGWKANEWRSKTLNIILYFGTNSDVVEDLQNKHYNSAAKALSKSSLRIVGFYDLDANGLTTEYGDFLLIKHNKGSKTIVQRPTWLPNNVSKEVNAAYGSVLEIIEPILEKEKHEQLENEKVSTCDDKKQIETVRKLKKEKLADIKREDETTKQRIETILQNLNQLFHHEF